MEWGKIYQVLATHVMLRRSTQGDGLTSLRGLWEYFSMTWINGTHPYLHANWLDKSSADALSLVFGADHQCV